MFDIFGLDIHINQQTSNYVLGNAYDKKRIEKRCKELYKEDSDSNLENTRDRLLETFILKNLSHPIYTHGKDGELKQIASPTRKIRIATINRILDAFVKNDWIMEECEDRNELKSIYEDFNIKRRLYDYRYKEVINALNDFVQEEKGLSHNLYISLLQYIH